MHGSKRKGAAAFAVLTIASLAVVASAFARADVGPAATAAPNAAATSATVGAPSVGTCGITYGSHFARSPASAPLRSPDQAMKTDALCI